MKKLELRKIIREEIENIDEQSYVTNNQYVESKIVRMIKSFSKEMEISPWEAHNLVRDTVGKLTDSFGEGRYD